MFEKVVGVERVVTFKMVDDLVMCWCEYVEMYLWYKNYDEVLVVMC